MIASSLRLYFSRSRNFTDLLLYTFKSHWHGSLKLRGWQTQSVHYLRHSFLLYLFLLFLIFAFSWTSFRFVYYLYPILWYEFLFELHTLFLTLINTLLFSSVETIFLFWRYDLILYYFRFIFFVILFLSLFSRMLLL